MVSVDSEDKEDEDEDETLEQIELIDNFVSKNCCSSKHDNHSESN